MDRMKSILSIITLFSLALFAVSNAHADQPINKPGEIIKTPDGELRFKADDGVQYYIWNDQCKEELGPFVGERIQVKGNSGTTAQGLDYIGWVVSVRALQ